MHLHIMKSTDFLEKIGHSKNQFHVRCPSTCVLTPVTFCLKAEIMTFSLGMRLQQWVEEGKGQYQKFPDGGNSALKLFAPFNFWIGFQNYCSSNVQQSFDRYREIEVKIKTFKGYSAGEEKDLLGRVESGGAGPGHVLRMSRPGWQPVLEVRLL